MRNKKNQDHAAAVLAIFGLLLFAAIQSGLAPWAIAFGGSTFLAMLARPRQWGPALQTGGSVSCVILLVGALNVMIPGWRHSLVAALG